MSGELGWAIIGTGTIARTLAAALHKTRTGRLVAVASRGQRTADKFGDDFHLPVGKRYCNHNALLADKDVQAVYIATPHPSHARYAIQAAEAGKHVLVEKPIAVSELEALAIVEAAARNDVLLMEAFMYRCHPQTQKLVDLIKNRAIGDLRVIQATNSFDEPFDPEGRLYNRSLGGGSILDIGCYPVSMARLLVGAAGNTDFNDPIDIQSVGHI
jgi:predicted dehydrogenase